MIGLGGVVSAPGLDYPDGSIHMAMGDGGYVGLVRVEDGSLNVAAAVSPSAMKRAGNPTSLLNSLLQGAGWPEIPEGRAPKWKGTPELTRRPAQVGAERILSVGDASGYVEPFTGEGMFWEPGLLPLWRPGSGSNGTLTFFLNGHPSTEGWWEGPNGPARPLLGHWHVPMWLKPLCEC